MTTSSITSRRAQQAAARIAAADSYIAQIHALAPDRQIYITADHGMNQKTTILNFRATRRRGGLRRLLPAAAQGPLIENHIYQEAACSTSTCATRRRRSVRAFAAGIPQIERVLTAERPPAPTGCRRPDRRLRALRRPRQRSAGGDRRAPHRGLAHARLALRARDPAHRALNPGKTPPATRTTRTWRPCSLNRSRVTAWHNTALPARALRPAFGGRPLRPGMRSGPLSAYLGLTGGAGSGNV